MRVVSGVHHQHQAWTASQTVIAFTCTLLPEQLVSRIFHDYYQNKYLV